MDASRRWNRVREFAPELQDRVQLFWAEFHTDDVKGNEDRRELMRLLRDPLEELSGLDVGGDARIDENWQVHSTFANHGFGVYWQPCLIAMFVSPAERSITLHGWKVRPAPTKRPPGWRERDE